ncbi:MAG: hypothetical protein KGL39_52620 [Patescibacteria group bacterium]|nr:hypothetical protein [Patescibacteria group bacterium]
MANQRKKTTSPRPSPPAERGQAAPKVTLVTDLAALEALHAEPVVCDVLVKGNPFRFTGRRLVPAESNEVKLLLERAMPPLVPGEKEGDEPRYDFRDAGYRETKEKYRRQARALCLWLAFPVFKERAGKADTSPQPSPQGGEGVKTKDQIADFIEHLALDDDVLEVLFRTVTSDIADTQKFVNFILGNSSPQS